MEERKQFLGRGWAWPPHLDPVSGQVAMSASEDDIRQAIRIIIETAPGERVMRPDFGCGIHELVFEIIDSATLQRVRAVVQDALVRYEARIDVLSVEVGTDESMDGALLIELEYRVRRTNQIGNLVYPFYFSEGGVRE
jgi:phage baseplate assembly protein W